MQVYFTLLDPVMSVLVRFQNKFFSRGSLHTLTCSYLLILILNDLSVMILANCFTSVLEKKFTFCELNIVQIRNYWN